MKPKIIIGSVIVIAFIIFGSYSFMESNVEYTDIAGAMAKHKKVQLKGSWDKDRQASFDSRTSQFTFWLVQSGPRRRCAEQLRACNECRRQGALH